MAKTAFKIPSSASIGDACVRDPVNLIDAKDVDPTDKKCKYQCCGGANGIPCAAEMTYIKQRKGEGYFGNLNKNSKHIAGCPFDKSLATKKIKHPNITGEGLTDDKLITALEKNGKKIHDDFIKGINHTGTIAGGGGKPAKKRDELDMRPRELVTADPKKLPELFNILKNIPEDAMYADMHICRRLINSRAIDGVREAGLGHNSWAVFIVKKTNKATEIRQDESEFIFEDAYAYAEKKTPVYFVLRIKEGEVRKQVAMMLKDKSADTRIIVCDQWYFDKRGKNNCLISQHYLNAGYLMFLSKDEYLD